jgi:hypothetical protein
METGRNFAMSGINSWHHNLPTYEISLKSNNAEFDFVCSPKGSDCGIVNVNIPTSGAEIGGAFGKIL